VFDFHPRDTDMGRLVEAWLALTFAVNSLNRSMGLHDLYPFVLAPPAAAKLAFVHELIAAASPAVPKTTAHNSRDTRNAPRRARSEAM